VNVDGVPYRTIWLDPEDRTAVRIIDQRKLPHRFEIATLRTADDFTAAIRGMAVRGAAVRRQLEGTSRGSDPTVKRRTARRIAEQIADENAEAGRKLGQHGAALIEDLSRRKGGAPVRILTHCNAGWLGMVDVVIVGSDRVTRAGDVANKIGTYQVALAARDNGVPFYAAVPASTFDREIEAEEIPIEERDPEEVRRASGLAEGDTDAISTGRAHAEGELEILSVLLCPETRAAKNYAFDVTPARLLTGLITETGILSSPIAVRASGRPSSPPGST